MPRNIPLHAAAGSPGKSVSGRGVAGGIKVRAPREMVYTRQSMKEYFTHIEAGPGHRCIIVKSEGPHVKDVEGLEITAEINLARQPPGCVDCHGPLEPANTLPRSQSAGARVQ